VSDPDVAPRVAAPDEPLRTPTWGLGDAAIGFLLAFVGSGVSGALALAASGADDFEDMSLAWANVAQLGLWGPMVFVTLWASWLKGNGAVRDFGLRVAPIDALVGGVAGVFFQIIVLPVFYVPIFWLTNTDVDELGETAREITDRADGAFSVTMLVILVVIGAPIVEELFYRGLVLRSLERRFGQVVAIVASGLFFGLVHIPNFIGVPGLALFGMFLAYITLRTGRLGLAIVCHMAFNAITVINLLAES
jgi:membrane protease YdiL (CAAX protease family)